jgi:hypothetical protein
MEEEEAFQKAPGQADKAVPALHISFHVHI